MRGYCNYSRGPHIAGTSRGSHKCYVNELKTHDGAPHVQFPHNDPFVITVQIANRRVHRALIDNGSSVNVLYNETLEKIGLMVSDLRACATTLYGFSGEGIVSMGAIDLVVTLG